ncbi:MAG: ribonuclease HII [Chitinophagales bacterium]
MSLLPYLFPNLIEAGCDEAGRGCLAGPVFAAAVILPKDFVYPQLNDSKKLNEKTRIILREVIEREALAFGVGICSAQEIDELNILNASFEAMHRALAKLSIRPEMILVDGNRFKPFQNIDHQCIIKGDGKYLSIAAASILAKTYRDDFMEKIHLQYPQYRWDSNKGYPTIAHRKAIEEYGSCAYHRQSFRLLATD